MRLLFTSLLAATLALPVLAQPPRGGGERERERPPERPMDRPKDNPDVERLMNRVKELEKQLAEAKGKKEDKKSEGDRKPEEKKPEGRKADVQSQPIPPREGPPPQFGGRFPDGPPFGVRGPSEGGNQFNPSGPPRDSKPRQMSGGMMGGPGAGMEALNKEEQEVFQKLMAKMHGAQQKFGKPNIEERLERLEDMMQKLMKKLDR